MVIPGHHRMTLIAIHPVGDHHPETRRAVRDPLGQRFRRLIQSDELS